jgi:hypothetical protein
MNINNELIKLFDEAIQKKYNYETKKYKRIYTNEYYLTNIFEMLNDINKWETLKKLKTYNPFLYKNKESKFHYKVIQNKFIKWCNDGIFKTVFQNFINKDNINKDIKLFIDGTFINNKYGIQDIGLNIDNKKKKASKLSIICNENKFIYSIISVKLNNVNKKCNGFKHDVNTIQDSLDNINKVYNFKNVSLIGDKGYITKKEFKYNNKKIELITSKRSNQKIQNNIINTKILKKRIYIENAISIIKKNERIMTRKDHNINSYLGFVYITCLKNNIKILNKIV